MVVDPIYSPLIKFSVITATFTGPRLRVQRIVITRLADRLATVLRRG